MRVVVVGYYYRDNLGDDQYMISIPFLLQMMGYIGEITFKNVSDLTENDFQEDDLIVLGGGDVIVPYFLDKLSIWTAGKNNRLLALSVGIPYVSCLNHPLLQKFEHVYVRTMQDKPLLRHYGDNISFIPDACLFYPWRIEPHRGEYQVLVYSAHHDVPEDIAHVVKCLKASKNKWILLPFDIGSHDDRRPLEEICSKVDRDDVTVWDGPMGVNQRLSVLKGALSVHAMRFHAFVFAAAFGVKVCPMETTRKIMNFSRDTLQINPVRIQDCTFDVDECHKADIKDWIDEATREITNKF